MSSASGRMETSMNKQEMSKERADPQFLRFDLLQDDDVRLLTHNDIKALVWLLEQQKNQSVLAARLYYQWREVQIRYPVADFRLKVMVGKP